MGYREAMCRLFGFRSAVSSRAHRSLVEAENALAVQAAEHQDGWGIGYYIGRDAYIIKSDASAHQSERFRLASSRLQSHTFVVHVRRATIGGRDHLNSHPFRFGRWTFAHNGTLEGFEHTKPWVLEKTHPSLRPLVFGSTDSEHFFYYLLSELGRAGVDRAGHDAVDSALAAQALRAAVDALYVKAAEQNLPPPILNFVLTNGDVFFAMRAGKELYMATQKNFCGDFETCAEPRKVCMESIRPDPRVNHLIVSSEKIGSEDIWEELPEGNMVVLDAGFRLSTLDAPPHFEECPPELRSQAIAAP
jgi:predicted glutamine amidotransferase